MKSTIISFIGMAATLSYIRFGPEAIGHEKEFWAFVLLMFLMIFVTSLIVRK